MTFNPVLGGQARSGGPAEPVTCGCGCATRPRRYPSDTTDAQWVIVEALLPAPACRGRRGGRPERHHRRAMIDALFYLVDNGVRWRALPADFPPWRTVYGFFARAAAGLGAQQLGDRLRESLRAAHRRNPRPSAGVIDSQSVKESADAVVPAATSGYDAFKKANGRKRHIITDTLGLLVAVIATPANTADRDVAPHLLEHAAPHGIAHLWADTAYYGDWRTRAHQQHGTTVEIIPRDPAIKGIQPLPRRWVVERTFAWITRRRRCARDYERLLDHHEAMVWWAAILQMTRRHARLTYHKPPNEV